MVKEVDRDVLREAFLRAQFSRRDAPRLADFPATLSAREVEEVYLPYIARQNKRMQEEFSLGEVHIIGYENDSAVTVAGDAVAAALPFADLLSADSFWPSLKHFSIL